MGVIYILYPIDLLQFCIKFNNFREQKLSSYSSDLGLLNYIIRLISDGFLFSKVIEFYTTLE